MRYLILFISLTLYSIPAFALSELEFDRINSNHGLSTEEIRNIFQDSRGYIWFLTREGLNRYDGYEFEVYKQGNPDLDFSSSSFESICEDKHGRLWLGTLDKGIMVFDVDAHSVTSFDSLSDGLKLDDLHIRSLLCDNSGDIWIGTEYGLYRYKPQSKKLVYYNLGALESDQPSWCIVEDLLEDADGNIWIATWNQGLFIYQRENQNLKNYSIFDGNSYTEHSNQIKTIFQDQLGFVWVGTWEDGLYMTRFEDDILSLEQTYIFDDNNPQSISGNIIYSINQDYNNNIWIGTPYGLTIIEGAYSEKPHYNRIVYKYGRDKGLCNNEVWKIVEDRSGLMWLGTLEGGANKVHPGGRLFDSFPIPPVSSQIQSQTTQAFCMDPLGNLLIGVKSLGFGKYDLKRKTYIPYTEFWPYKQIPYAINSVNCFQVLGDELWLGTRYLGLIIFNTRTNNYTTLSSIDSGFTPFEINTITLAGDGSAWVGTEEGLFRVTGIDQQNHKVDRISALSEMRIKTVLQDQDMNIWVGTSENGIILLKGEDEQYEPVGYFSQDLGNIPSNHINALLQNARSQIWAGTREQGLLLYNDSIGAFEKSQILINTKRDAIMSMLEDRDGSLWLTTNGGIIRIYDKNGSLKSDSYTVADGLQGNIFLPNSLFQLNENRIFAGGYYGFNAFYPHSLRQNEFIPPTVITSISANESPILHPGAGGEPIILKHNQNNLEINFSSLSYHKSEKNVFAYKLDDVNDQWQYMDATQRYIKYSNLKAGSYRFLVKSANSSEVWNENPEIIEFSILTPPWKTWWAITIYILFALLFISGLFRYLLNNERMKRAYELEKLEHARAEKLNQFKLRFFTNISHELLTPLSIMYCSIDLLKTKTRKGKPELVILERNIAQLKRLLSQLLDFRKMESGHLKLKVRRANLSDCIESIVENFRPLANKQQLKLQMETSSKMQMGYFDEDKLNKVMHNLLSNAIKYTPAGGMIMVSLDTWKNTEGNWTKIKVSDSGVGIPEEGLKHVFERFYRAEIDKDETGTGLGLSLTRNLVELHKGSIQVSSEPGKGTVFTFDIPIHQSAFDPDELSREDVNRVITGDKVTEPLPELATVSKQTPKELKILLAEDNSDFREILRSSLLSQYQVLEAENGNTALEIALKENPDLIISDVMMPEKTGLELCSELKNNIETKMIPVILLTAKTSDGDIAEGYLSGADSFITKPVSLPVLHSRITSLLLKRVNLEAVPEEPLKQVAVNRKLSNEQFIRLLKKVISSNLSDSEFQVSDMHIHFGMSSSNFYRKVKELTKLAPVEYVKNFRLNRAASLLKKGNLSIAEIAYGTGFSDQSYFGVCFKKQFGITPSAYSRKVSVIPSP